MTKQATNAKVKKKDNSISDKLDKFLLSEFQNKKLITLILAAMGLFVIFILAFKPADDPDLGWHLRSGELMLQYGIIPHIDWFSYTMPTFPWINHEWLTDIMMFLVYSLSGYWGLSIIYALIATLVFGYLIGEAAFIKPRWENRILIGLLIALVSSAFIGVRPQVFTLLFLSLILIMLKHLYKNEKTKAVWLLPLLFLIWVNMHASFTAGFMVLGFIILTEIIKIDRLKKVGESDWVKKEYTMTLKAWKNLATATVISAGTLFLNPYSYELLTEVKRTFGDSYAPSRIIEWLSPNFHQTEGLLLLLLVFLFLEILFLSRKKMDPTRFIIISVFLWMAFQANRHIPLFALMIAPFLLETMQGVPETITIGTIKNKFIFISTIFFFILYVLAFSPLQYTLAFLSEPKAYAHNSGYPENAIAFIKNHPIQGNVFNSYGWGGYIIQNNTCRLSPSKTMDCTPKVFIDGRMAQWNIPSRAILKDYSDIYGVEENWKFLIDQYDISWIFVERNSTLDKILNLSPDWKNTYKDETAVIYEMKK